MEPCAPGVTEYNLDGSIPSKCVDPLTIFTFISTSTISNGSKHLKYPFRKLHLGFRIKAIWKISYIVIQI